MPGLDGFQMAERLRTEVGSADAVILMLTSDNLAGDLERVRELGIRGYLVKPLKRSELRLVINTILAGRDEMRSTVPPERLSVTGESLRPLSILLAEDVEANRMVVRSYLQNTPYRLDVAENGEIACRKFSQGSYDLILMDIQMPVMDGCDASRWIRKWEKKKRKKPVTIIALTAHSVGSGTKNCLEAGCDSYLGKPVRKHDLLTAIASLVPEVPSSVQSDNSAPVELSILAGALKQLDGDRSLLLRLIRNFHQDHGNAVAEIREALSRGDRETALRLAHTLKGVTGNLAAAEAHQAMANIEKGLGQGTADGRKLDRLLDRADVAVARFLASTRRLLAESEEESANVIEAGQGSSSTEESAVLLTGLCAALTEGDPVGAEKHLAALWRGLATEQDDGRFIILRQQIASYDFDDALGTLKKCLF
jgi:CheY-like chemotaxis protein/HPt (histidine-containing phosphotransfer) domain-containing protein